MRFKLAGFPMSTPGSRRCGEDRSRELPRDRVHHWALIGLVDSIIMRSPISLTSLSHGHSGPLALHNLALRIMGERQENIEGQPAHGAVAIELLGDRHKGHSPAIENLQQ